jgi:hypothetical protein|tara:strand:- start:148 stop:384 length:237 start_codon:yes stop_codon:yes gene_type:complete
MTLDLRTCEKVLKKAHTGVHPDKIAASFGITYDHVKLIQKCYREKYPLNDYLKIENGNYVRLESRLLRLPMSEWASAI